MAGLLKIGTRRALLRRRGGGAALPAGVVLAIPITEASGAPGAVIDGAPVAGAATVGTTGRETVGGVFGATFSSAVVGYGDVTALDGATAATFVLSVRPASFGLGGVLNKRTNSGSQDAFSLGFGYVSNNVFDCELAGETNYYRWSTSGWSTSAYQQLIVVYDSAAAAGQRQKLWRNGSLVSVLDARADGTPAIPNTTSPMELGRVNNGTFYYSGGLAYAYAWRRALSADEIAAVWDVLGAGDKTRPTS